MAVEREDVMGNVISLSGNVCLRAGPHQRLKVVLVLLLRRFGAVEVLRRFVRSQHRL